jgi:multidrug efflux pump subunit AcrA (membrane-fusion protein)
MDILKAEMARKRKALESIKEESAGDGAAGGAKKFIKQSDLIQAREAEREAAQRQADEARLRQQQQLEEQQQAAARAQQQAEARRQQNGPSVANAAGSANGEKGSDSQHPHDSAVTALTSTNGGAMSLSVCIEQLEALSSELVKSRLRAVQEPVTLFGESESDRIRRLAERLLDEGSERHTQQARSRAGAAATAAAASSSSKKPEHDDLDIDDGDDEDNEYKEKESGGQSRANDNEDDDDSENDSPSPRTGGASAKSPKATNFPRDINGNIVYSKIEPPLSKEKLVLKYFRSLLKQWEADLHAREDYVKLSARGSWVYTA